MSNMITNLHETAFWELNYNPELTILELHWKKQSNREMPDAEFKKHLLLLVGFINDYGVRSFRVDCRDYHVVMSLAIQQWHDAVIVPEYLKSGVAKIAFILPPDIIQALSIEQTFNEQNAKALTVAYFENEADSEAWLSK